MKKMPLILLIFLMLLVVVSGIVDSGDMQQYPDERHEQYDLLFTPPFDVKELQTGERLLIHLPPPSFPVDEKFVLKDNIEKAETIVSNLNNATMRLKKEGNDVQELEQRTGKYATLVSEAKMYLAEAETSSVKSDEEKYLKLSRGSIIRANSELKSIFAKMKEYLPGPVTIYDNTNLVAEGSGIVILSGDFDTSFFLSGGKFSVVDFAGDMLIDSEKDYNQEVLPERETMTGYIKPYRTVSYVEVEGNVSLSGTDFSVAIMAEKISLLATGVGEAELIGNGTYYFDNGTSDREENLWEKQMFERD